MLDEVHEWEGEKGVNTHGVITNAGAARRNSLYVSISTVGADVLHPADVPTPDAPEPLDALWSCVRELGHDGPHVGVVVQPGTNMLHWRDTPAGTDGAGVGHDGHKEAAP